MLIDKENANTMSMHICIFDYLKYRNTYAGGCEGRMSLDQDTVPARRGGRGERRAIRTKPNHDMLPHLTGTLPLTAPMSQDQVEQIDKASLDILEEVGVVFVLEFGRFVAAVCFRRLWRHLTALLERHSRGLRLIL